MVSRRFFHGALQAMLHHVVVMGICLCAQTISFVVNKTSLAPIVPAVILFGDSIVDPGNNNDIKTFAKSNFPPYGRDFIGHIPTGRFSNGKIPGDLIVVLIEHGMKRKLMFKHIRLELVTFPPRSGECPEEVKHCAFRVDIYSTDLDMEELGIDGPQISGDVTMLPPTEMSGFLHLLRP